MTNLTTSMQSCCTPSNTVIVCIATCSSAQVSCSYCITRIPVQLNDMHMYIEPIITLRKLHYVAIHSYLCILTQHVNAELLSLLYTLLSEWMYFSKTWSRLERITQVSYTCTTTVTMYTCTWYTALIKALDILNAIDKSWRVHNAHLTSIEVSDVKYQLFFSTHITLRIAIVIVPQFGVMDAVFTEKDV